MVSESKSFAARLQHQLALRGRPISPTQLARDFNLRWRGTPVSTNAARNWLHGPTLPTMDKIQVLAKMLGTSAEWLRWGELKNIQDKYHISQEYLINDQIHNLNKTDSGWSLLSKENRDLISHIVIFYFIIKQKGDIICLYLS